MPTKGGHMRLKYFRTISLTAAFFALGLCIALLGPTVPTLAYNLNVEESSLSFIYTARGGGYLLGSILSSLLFKLLNPYLVIALSLTLTALGNFGAPFMPSTLLLAALLLSAGCSMGVLDTGGNVLCLKLWGAKSETWMQILHFSFALGASLAPLLAQPFINEVENLKTGDNITHHENSSVINVDYESTVGSLTTNLESSRGNFPDVSWAFIVASSISLVISVIFYFLSCAPNRETDSCQEDTIKQEGTKFRVQILGLLFIFYFLYVGTEVTFGLFIYSFAIHCQKQYSKAEGAFLNSLFWGAFAVGRFMAIFLSRCLSPKFMLTLDLIGTVISTVIMALFPLYADSAELLLWGAVAVYGWSMASLFPSGISWAERYITVTGRAATVLVVGAALGEMALPFFMGHLIEHNAMNLMYFCVISTGVSTLNFLILVRVASQRGSRLRNSSSTRKPLSVDVKTEEDNVEEYALLSTKESEVQQPDSIFSSSEEG